MTDKKRVSMRACPTCSTTQRWPRPRILNADATARVYCDDDWHDPAEQRAEENLRLADGLRDDLQTAEQQRDRYKEGASAFTFFPDDDPKQWHDAIKVERTNWGFGHPLPKGKQWAIRRLHRCLNADGEWEWEPQPSSREPEFLKRCRFDLDEAIALARLALSPQESEGGE